MATQVIQAHGVSPVCSGSRPSSRAAVERSPLATIRWLAVVVLLVLGLCGLVATGSWAVAGTTPPGGPEPGLVQ
jgi:hypothetical protein